MPQSPASVAPLPWRVSLCPPHDKDDRSVCFFSPVVRCVAVASQAATLAKSGRSHRAQRPQCSQPAGCSAAGPPEPAFLHREAEPAVGRVSGGGPADASAHSRSRTAPTTEAPGRSGSVWVSTQGREAADVHSLLVTRSLSPLLQWELSCQPHRSSALSSSETLHSHRVVGLAEHPWDRRERSGSFYRWDYQAGEVTCRKSQKELRAELAWDSVFPSGFCVPCVWSLCL